MVGKLVSHAGATSHVTYVLHQLTNASRSITVPYPDVDSIETKCDIRLLVKPFTAARGPRMIG